MVQYLVNKHVAHQHVTFDLGNGDFSIANFGDIDLKVGFLLKYLIQLRRN
jgi:hypothetical protein